MNLTKAIIKSQGPFSGAALGQVPWVPVNQWISRIYAKEPLNLEKKFDLLNFGFFFGENCLFFRKNRFSLCLRKKFQLPPETRYQAII